MAKAQRGAPGRHSFLAAAGLKEVRRTWQLYLMVALPVVFVAVFRYVPMYGAQIAFRNYKYVQGILGSQWVGMEYMRRFVTSPMFSRLMTNTLLLNIQSLVIGFPFPIVFALVLHYVRSPRYKKIVQTVTYAPHFISTVVIVGLLKQLTNASYGVINQAIAALGFEKIDFFGRPQFFRALYIGSGLWQSTGWNSIIYLSALSGVDPQLHEAATIDGADIMRRIWHIDLPGITPTIVILLIMSFGSFLSTGFEKVFLMQTPLNLSVSETIDTYVYKIGLEGGNFSYSTAIGLFQSIVGFLMVVLVNGASKKISDTALW